MGTFPPADNHIVLAHGEEDSISSDIIFPKDYLMAKL